MAIILDDFDQRSEQWHQHRLGNPGASSVSKIITNSGEISKQRTEYLYQLAGETICGAAEDTFQSQAMLNGCEREDASRSLFEMIYGVDVKQAGIVFKDEKRLFHCSPDGLVNDDAVLELKNPQLKTQVKYLIENKLPSDYFSQCQMALYTCERSLLYFMSCFIGLPPLIIEVQRDEKFIGQLAKALDGFCLDLAGIVEKLRALK